MRIIMLGLSFAVSTWIAYGLSRWFWSWLRIPSNDAIALSLLAGLCTMLAAAMFAWDYYQGDKHRNAPSD